MLPHRQHKSARIRAVIPTPRPQGGALTAFRRHRRGDAFELFLPPFLALVPLGDARLVAPAVGCAGLVQQAPRSPGKPGRKVDEIRHLAQATAEALGVGRSTIDRDAGPNGPLEGRKPKKTGRLVAQMGHLAQMTADALGVSDQTINNDVGAKKWAPSGRKAQGNEAVSCHVAALPSLSHHRGGADVPVADRPRLQLHSGRPPVSDRARSVHLQPLRMRGIRARMSRPRRAVHRALLWRCAPITSARSPRPSAALCRVVSYSPDMSKHAFFGTDAEAIPDRYKGPQRRNPSQ